ncbi:MAG TPA: hypothetical protein VI756_17830 [Blastocatellia bacterium]
MRTRVSVAILAAVLCGAAFEALGAAPQNQQSKTNVESLLESQYVPSKAAGDNQVATPGSVLVIQKDGILGDGQSGLRIGSTPNNYKDGHFKHGTLSALGVSHTSGGARPFAVGDRVYLLKIDVKDSEVVFNVLSCAAIDGVIYKSTVSFQFGKGYLDNADTAKIQQTIGEVFSVDSGAGAAQPGGQTQMAPIQPPAPPPDQPPPAIELGQTPEQVVAIMGQPQKVVKLADKEIYVYKDLKVTFKNGKVSDVE